MKYLLALDQGTSSSRAIVFDALGNAVSMAQKETTQHYPKSAWVEHDPLEIWQTQLATAQQAVAQARITPSQIAGIGITNQRETSIVWNRSTGEPIYPAIVWQDRRTEPLCAQLRAQGLAQTIAQKTGLVIDAYFSATKLHWILNNVPNAQSQAENGALAFGTVDSWLLWQLTQGQVHATDVSNASRTMLFNIHTNTWDQDLLRLLNIPPSLLPHVLPSSYIYGHTRAALLIPDASPDATIAIAGVAGDQQSALFGQACFEPGMAKNTYGTGCFLLMNTGTQALASKNSLLTTSTAQLSLENTNNQKNSSTLQDNIIFSKQYALEGSVFIGGAVVQWLRDGLKIINHSAQVQELAQSVPDAGGVVFVPAFTGLGAPYWQPNARGAILGMTRATTHAHIARAALESIAFQSASLLQAMNHDVTTHAGTALRELRVDGGACANDLLMQFQSDLLGIDVVRPKTIETTALGVAYLAGLATGLYSNTQSLSQMWQQDRRFKPSISQNEAQARMQEWSYAIKQVTTG